ncbi:Uncharacterised protein [Salmonella enterica subsp. enterica serovar Bovismorbificans]|uniref:Uncharacterized protein n=1 Tax=Salmonella enterica subsp. enterica serovar Bovismorbificans TaxID=58097 RepID=A0A655CQL8_SALET|nr:Uncharacterised protein [Salmonella enterica subsp. enterica serovar Bovismorbificans]CNU46514.1 Uncharacterised protein [Salmonella enterica subsp. enterica serovar Bovismorbificans]
MRQVKRDVKTGQCNTTDDLIDMIKFRFFGTHEFAPGGRIIKEIQNFQGGADRVRGGFYRHVHVTPFRIRLPGFRLLRRARR